MKLLNNLDLSGVSNWTPIGNSTVAFKGIFDGRGHEIFNLTVNSDGDYYGLFGRCVGATVQNLSVYGNVSGTYKYSHGGGIIGELINGKIDNCSFSGKVNGSGYEAGGIAGTLLGIISRCRNTATVSGSAGKLGGIVARAESGRNEVRYCYNQGNVISEDCSNAFAGGIIGYAIIDNGLNVFSCYSTGTVTADGNNSYFGGIIGYCGGDTSLISISDSYFLESGSSDNDGIGKSSDAFGSGEVAWLLQNAADEADSQVWGQTIGTDTYPVFATADGSNTVCKVTFKADGKDDQIKYVNKGGTVSIANPTDPTGYTFDGWYTAQEVGTKFDLTTAITSDITLYARFALNTYTVLYASAAGGSSDEVTDSKSHGIDLTLKGAIFTRDGYIQTGWQTMTGKKYDLGGTYTDNVSVTLYPVWTVNQYSNEAPQTGDNSNMALWTVALLVSGAALSGTVFYGKRKKRFVN